MYHSDGKSVKREDSPDGEVEGSRFEVIGKDYKDYKHYKNYKDYKCYMKKRKTI